LLLVLVLVLVLLRRCKKGREAAKEPGWGGELEAEE
jgi:hypothetical protein